MLVAFLIAAWTYIAIKFKKSERLKKWLKGVFGTKISSK